MATTDATSASAPSPSEFPNLLTTQPQTLLHPTPSVYNSALSLAKEYLDPLAADVTEAQLQRQKVERQQKKSSRGQKRKRAGDDNDDGAGREQEMLRMKKVYTEGFEAEQVWEQAKRVVDAGVREVEMAVPEAARIRGGSGGVENSEAGSEGKDERAFSDDEDDVDSLGEEGVDWEYDEDGQSLDERDGQAIPYEELESDVEESVDEEDVDSTADDDETPPSDYSSSEENEEEKEEDEEKEKEKEAPAEELIKDKFGLNDGFFSIDTFNKQSQFLENQDARGDANDGAASDEEEVNWDIDPLEAGAQISLGGSKKEIKGKRNEKGEKFDEDNEEDEDEGDEEEGPGFGNADLNGIDDDDDEDEEGDAFNVMDLAGGSNDFSNTNNVLYKDFFAPPARPKGQHEKRKPRPVKGRALTPPPGTSKAELAGEDNENDSEEDADMRRAMSSVHRDLYESASSEEDDAHPSKKRKSNQKSQDQEVKNLSTHERTQLAIRDQIRRLEAENVAAKPWSLTGETVAPARPENALLEEDLDFERAGKPVPIVTAEVNEDIEALIRRRILAREFDEVIRRRPGSEVSGTNRAKRGLVDDPLENGAGGKGQRPGLAEQYEDSHLRSTDPNYVDQRSESLKATHAAIEKHWASVCASLDALSNWHYRPRPPEPSMEVRTDAPVVRMEEARPAGGVEDGGGAEGRMMLAPQEMYGHRRDGKSKEESGLVRTKGGNVVAKEEEGRESRLRRRRREKERLKKANGAKPANGAVANGKAPAGKDAATNSKRADKSAILGQLQKSGVQVLDKNASAAGGHRDEGAAEAKGKGTSGGGGAARYLL
ncbi:MAG: U3 snoRNP protein [Alyxoria varia]|nr:MAG: U3 snoRNP protein [Alyxoria varia]